jgi:hypothetical protein
VWKKGWYNPTHRALWSLGPWNPPPWCCTMVKGVFEGMKAYRNKQGQVQLFRPRENFKRLNTSNRKLCIPEIDEAFALEVLKQLLTVEQDWIPSAAGNFALHPAHHHRHGPLFGRTGVVYLPVLHHFQSGGSLLCRRVQPGKNHGHQGTCAGRARWRGGHQNIGQLCGQPVGRRRGPQGRLHPGAVAGRCRAEVCRRSGAP